MTAKYILEFSIPALPKSPNQLLGAHWTVRANHAKRWERLVWGYVWPHKPKEPLKKAKVTFIRHSIRVMDADNLRSSFKCVADSLVKLGIIADDSMAVIGEPIVRHEKTKRKEQKITIKVEEICEGF